MARAGLVATVAVSLSCALFLPATPAQAQAVTGAETRVAPVTLDGRTLFKVRGVSSLTAAERAEMIGERIREVAADPRFDPQQVQIAEAPQMLQITAGPVVIVRVFDADAEVEQVDRMALAAVQLQLIREAIADYRDHRKPEYLQRGLRTVVVATAALAAFLTLSLWLARRLGNVLAARLQPKVVAIRVQSLQLMPGSQVWATMTFAGRALRVIVVLLAVYIYAEVSLGQFPQTRALGEQLAGYVIDPLQIMGRGFLDELPSLIFLLVLFFVVRLVMRLLRLYFTAVGTGTVKLANFAPEWAVPTFRLVRIGVIAFALVIAYPYVPGSGSEAFKGLSIFFGVLLSIGSSSFVANSIGGYALIYRRLFAIGDRVQIGDTVGDVVEMRLQVTRLRTVKNEEIIVPNSLILNTSVLNYSALAASRGLILHTQVGIGYETPWRQVESMLLMAAQRTPGLMTEPPPFVLQKALGDFCVTYELNVYTSSANSMAQNYHALHANILDVFNEYGVQIMTPAYEADPPQPKVVPRELWYAEPSPPPPSGGPGTPGTSVSPPRR